MPMRPIAATAGALLGATTLFLLPFSSPAAAQHAAAQHSAPQPGADDRDAPRVVAHRGASGYAPENTLAAVDKADELGIRWVENDVQRTRDGELVVLHDTTLERTTNAEEVFPGRAPWRVADFTAAEIARLDAGSWFGPEYAGERVPTLEQFLGRVGQNHQKLLLELKRPDLYPGVEAQTLKELANEGWLRRHHPADRLVIQSFDADAVRTVHALAPAVKTGFLGSPAVAELPGYAAFADQINPRWTTVSEEYVDAVHALKGPHGKPLEVFTWTVDDGAAATALAGADVDGIISNRPDVVRDALER
ncbi:glycerophosphodiester phosphodiesterase family protein [Streptomyces sp. JJ36]|uniref:glycerophosphodiester phosphodiesterase n=1 Tax=Streptomyces sp. JJ36 TaxID=2736645 RepID=UPI001F227473|nr:glycerophosphodiester phosphodiesterase family protein [Streptomyces sp. JJ36]MCF6521499.1 glycerophosphodiester phosphodiesterase [Streptomyces sp. JJ36]